MAYLELAKTDPKLRRKITISAPIFYPKQRKVTISAPIFTANDRQIQEAFEPTQNGEEWKQHTGTPFLLK
jgi:hypothetical protein